MPARMSFSNAAGIVLVVTTRDNCLRYGQTALNIQMTYNSTGSDVRRAQGPDMGKCRPGASRKVPSPHSQWRNRRFEPGGKLF